MRKQLQAEHGKADLEKKIAELEARKTKQTNKVIELKNKLSAIERRNAERKDQEDKKRSAEIEFLKYQEKHLQTFLKSVTESNNK
jgi:dynein light intermediate chain, axonemal